MAIGDLDGGCYRGGWDDLAMTNPLTPPPAVQEAIATHAKRDPWRKGQLDLTPARQDGLAAVHR